MTDLPGVLETARRVRAREVSAVEGVETALRTLSAANPTLNAATRILHARARAGAAALDSKIAAGVDPGPLAGVPFGVKDLFDVEGLPTTAGAGMRREAPAALRDATAIARLTSAGAVLTATLNMDEFAYGFATENATWGVTRNPHDPTRLAGGSSGGSAVAVGGGLLPLALGSDTNGSIRVPASLCGVYGLRPTQGASPMRGVFPFVDSFDVIGPFTRSVADLELVWRVLGDDLVGSAPAAASPRVAILGGWFSRNLDPLLAKALDDLAHAYAAPTISLPQVARARSAAFLMTAAEGGARHLPALREDPLKFDPAIRDRLIAGAALPYAAYHDAVHFRAEFRAQVLERFRDHDVLIAPSTGGVAPRIDAPVVMVDGEAISARAHLGIYTQPISFVGLPVIAAPLRTASPLPLGVQLIAAPGREATLIALARGLEAEGWIGCRPPVPCWE